MTAPGLTAAEEYDALLERAAPYLTHERFNPHHGKGGRFSSGGGGGGAGTAVAGGGGGGGAAEPVEAIDSDLHAGKAATCAPSQVGPLMNRLAAEEPCNLAKLQVTGSGNEHLYREHAREIPRSQMPQLPETAKDLAPFTAKLGKMGITAKIEKVDPRSLHATQSQLDGHKVGQLHGFITTGGWKADAVLITAKDGSILDGHHRWAAASAAVVSGKKFKVTILRVNTDIDTLLGAANEVSLPRKSLEQGL